MTVQNFSFTLSVLSAKTMFKRTGSTMFGVVASVLAVECTRMQQLPTILGPAVHRGKDTTHKTLKTMCNLRAWLQQLMLKEVCKRIQHCCATLRRSQSKRNLGSCWLKILLANKFASVWTRSHGWRSGESTRLPPMWPRFKSRRRCHNMSWVSSERFFSGYSRFSSLLKNQHLQIPIPQESGRRRTALWMCYLQIIIYLFYFNNYLLIMTIIKFSNLIGCQLHWFQP